MRPDVAMDLTLRRPHIREAATADGPIVIVRPLRFHRVVAAYKDVPQHVSRWHTS